MLVYYKSNRNMILTDCSTVGTVWGGKELTMDDIRVTYDLLHCTLGLFFPSSSRLPSLMLPLFLWALFIRIPLFRPVSMGYTWRLPFTALDLVLPVVLLDTVTLIDSHR